MLSHRGKRSSNLDRVTVDVIQFDWYVCETYQLYAVFDGHVTATVSDYLKQHLLPTIVSALSVGNDFAQAALHSTIDLIQVSLKSKKKCWLFRVSQRSSLEAPRPLSAWWQVTTCSLPTLATPEPSSSQIRASYDL